MSPLAPPKPKLSPSQQQGLLAENKALLWLEQAGFIVLDRRWRSKRGELDIVIEDPSTSEIIFVEVKARSSLCGGHPGQAVGWKKWQRWRHTALEWLATYQVTKSYRFAIISVLPNKLEWFDHISWTR